MHKHHFIQVLLILLKTIYYNILAFNNAVYLREGKIPFFQTLLGFTKDEINQNFDEIIPKILDKAEKTSDQFWDDLDRYYNGYLPNPFATTFIYNPYSIQKYFSDENGELTPYFANSGSTRQLFLILRRLSLENLNEFLQIIIDENYLIPIDKDQMIKRKEWNIYSWRIFIKLLLIQFILPIQVKTEKKF